MSDAPGGPGLPEYTPEPADQGLWARLQAAPTWVKVAVPAAIIALALFVGVLIGQAGNGSSTAASDEETERILAELAEQLAAQEAAASTTTTIPVTLPETTTTVAETTTTVPETTTTVPETTTTIPVTTTTVPATTTTTTTTLPATTTTVPETTTTQPPPTEPPPTEPPPTEPPPTEPPPTEPPPTEPPPTEPEITIAPPPELPPGALFGSLDDLQATWNATAQGSSVAPINSWTPIEVLGRQANVANLGGNLRVAALTGEDGFVSQVVLAWLPLADASQEQQQNALFQDSFAVLVRTVHPGATAGQQADLAAQLGLSADQPPFPLGAEAQATLEPQRYLLQALEVPGQNGPVTLVAATSAAPR